MNGNETTTRLRRAMATVAMLDDRLKKAERRANAPIAIVGMSCRLPGGIHTPDELWRALRDGRDLVSGCPNRPSWKQAMVDRLVTREGGFVHDADLFDAAFFRIGRREAVSMDAQHRLLLEGAWEAIERAGIVPATLERSATGVYVGISYSSSAEDLGLDSLNGYLMTGMSPSTASGRIAYTLGLQGPAVSLDTACSSSLVATHMAMQALRSGDCDLALAGGVTLMANPGIFVEFGVQGGLAPDGRCKPFSDAADGVGWGEGCGMVLLERLSDAQRNGRRVLAVLRGSALNQDGRSQGFTAPNGPSQERVIKRALASAGLGAADVDAVEAHGTGTTLGDPIEAGALLATYGQAHSAERPLLLGSIKGNMGHAQSAAGVAGMIKLVLALQHGELPPSLHADRPTRHVDWSQGHIELLARAVPWKRGERVRRAGLSSFGISGTNAHVIIEEAPEIEKAPEIGGAFEDGSGAAPSPAGDGVDSAQRTRSLCDVPIVVTGASDAALQDNAGRLANWLVDHGELSLAEIGRSTLLTRTMHRRRKAVVAGLDQREAVIGSLRAVAEGRAAPGLVDPPDGHRTGRLAAIFTGQGTQHAGMGQALAATDHRFRAHLQAVAAAVDAHLGRSLLELMFAPEGSEAARELDCTELAQPAIFALELALWRTMHEVGVRPHVLLGHSIGEISAVCAAGMLDEDDAAKLVVTRGRLMQRCPAGGAMAAIRAEEQEVERRLCDGACIAAVNGPQHVVISGDVAAVDAVAAHFRGRGTKVSRLNVSHAFHSAHMDDAMQGLRDVAATLTVHEPAIPVLGLVKMEPLAASDLASGEYWSRQVRQAVRFHDGVTKLHAEGVRTWLECGPRGVLSAAVAESASPSFPIAAHGKGEASLSRAAASLQVAGHAVDWGAWFAGTGIRQVELPTYAFQRESFWLEAGEGQSSASGIGDAELWSAVASGDAVRLARELAVPDELQGELARLLPHLASWRERREADAELAQLFYQERWIQVDAAAQHPGAAGRWLLVTCDDLDAEAHALADCVSRGCDELVTVQVEVNGTREALAQELEQAGPVERIVSLVGLARGWQGSVPHGLPLTLRMAQACADAAPEVPLWVVTRGAVEVGREGVANPDQTLLWGFVRALMMERGERWCGAVDVGDDQRSLDQLGSVLASSAGEDQLALRGGTLWGRRIVHGERLPQAEPFQTAGTVLVTGGTGNLGGHAARWFVEHGATHVLLLSRRGAGAAGTAELVQQLEAMGAQVSVEACDVTDRAALSALIDRVDQSSAPLRAVVHAAGVFGLGPLGSLSEAQLEQELAAKVGGARCLDQVVGERALDAFVLYGSIAGLWGAGEQSLYSASNAFLDGLARSRRARGLTANLLHWGSWTGGGMASAEAEAFMRSRGVIPMTPERAIGGLALALDPGSTAVVIADIVWERFAPLFCSARPRRLFDAIDEARRVLGGEEGVEPSSADETALRAELLALGEVERRSRLETLVADEAAAVLGRTDVDPDVGYFDLGLDSLMAVELRKRLVARTGLAIPTTLVFDQPTVEKTAAWISSQLEGEAPVVAPERPAQREDAVAVVGVGMRLPGEVTTLGELWELVAGARQTRRPISKERFDIEPLFDPDPDAQGKSYVRHASMLEDVAGFDAALFGVSPREAAPMDPQHRLLLEAAWTALEHAGIAPRSLRGSETGVFVGASAGEYTSTAAQSGVLASGEAGAHAVLGMQISFAAGRIAYHLGLEGPVMTVDTACSSSLVAVHLACEAIRRGDCQLALAAGVQVMTSADPFVSMSSLRALAPDGICKTFSDAADGYGRGEGVGVIALMPLAEAERQGRRVLAVVRGSAVNHDGASSGISAPNGLAQRKVIRAALRSAGLSPLDVDVVECHGTGTSLGDPIEVQAVGETYGRERAERPVVIGALKANVGHLEAAAGVAGVLKILACMAHEGLPPSPHSRPLSTRIDWEQLDVQVLESTTRWPRGERPRRAGISAFGVSGTNAHLVLEEPAEAIAHDEVQAGEGNEEAVALLISGQTEGALQGNAERLCGWLETHPTASLSDVAYSLTTTRSALRERAVITCADRPAALDGLRAVAGAAPAAGVLRATAQRRRVAFLFPGQGSQHLGMCRGLLQDTAFLDALRECDDSLVRHGATSVEALLRADEDQQRDALTRTDVVQPALFAVALALARVWTARGLVPAAVVGHSQGEVPAAVVAGALSVDDGARVVALRSRLVAQLKGGTMASLSIPVAEAEALLQADYPQVAVAAVNTTEATVVAGPVAAIEALLASVSERGVHCKRVAVDYAAHTAQIDPLMEPISAGLASITPRDGEVPMLSTVLGRRVAGSELDGRYWAENLRQPVRLDRVLEQLGQEHALLEMSSHPVLVGPLGMSGRDAVVGTLRREEAASRSLARASGELWVHGVALECGQCYPDAREVELPTYAFEHVRYWLLAGKRSSAVGGVAGETSRWPLAGARVELPGGGFLHTLEVGPAVQAYLADHVVFGRIVAPGALHVATIMAIAATHWPGRAIELRDVQFVEPMTFDMPDESVTVQVHLVEQGDGALRATLAARREEGLVVHAMATMRPLEDSEPRGGSAPEADGPALRSTSMDQLLEALRAVNVEWGDRWRWMTHVESFDAERHVGRFEPPPGSPTEESPIAPILLDNTFALGLAHAAFAGASAENAVPQLPLLIDRVVWTGEVGAVTRAETTGVAAGASTTAFDLRLVDASGAIHTTLESFTVHRAPRERFLRRDQAAALYVLDREASPAAKGPPPAACTVVNADPGQLAPLAADPPAVLGVRWELPAASPEAVHDAVRRGIAWLEAWSGEPRLAETRVVWITEHTVAGGAMDPLPNPAAAALWGLARSFSIEQPDRSLVLVDVDAVRDVAACEAMAAMLPAGENQLIFRDGEFQGLRLRKASPERTLRTPDEDYRLEPRTKGSLETLELVPWSEAAEMSPGQVRIAVRAASMNFRDVLNALGALEGDLEPLGGEAAGVVVAVADDVVGIEPGDRVFGMVRGAFGSVCDTDARLAGHLPETISFAEAATVTAAFITVFLGLDDVDQLRPGEKILIHAAAGGVGMAAVQFAQMRGAEVFATASPPKWPVLERLGIPRDHIASSRDTNFRETFLQTTGGRGVDVVLNSLVKEKIDASLDLLGPGGRFLEMGKIDYRDPADIDRDHPGVIYRPFDLATADIERVARHFANLLEHLRAGRLKPLPFRAYEFGQARDAFRLMAAGRSVGKQVLVPRRRLGGEGTVLITGGLGGLGRVTATHLVQHHGARHLLILSRRGEDAPDAAEVLAELRHAGAATVTLRACDVSREDELEAAIAAVPAEHPLAAVFHLAVVVDDALLAEMDAARVERILRPKVDGAFHLDRLTRRCDLAAFVVFSSAAGVMGSAAQSAYAAANAAVDALVARRRSRGLMGTSLAWGSWAEVGLAAGLSEALQQRMRRSAVIPLAPEDGLRLFDEALELADPVMVPIHLDGSLLQRSATASQESFPPLLRGLVRRVAGPGSRRSNRLDLLTAKLERAGVDERTGVMLEIIQSVVADVLRLESPAAVPAHRPLQELGLDSLLAVEIRNHLSAILGRKLAARLLFEHPSPAGLATAIAGQGTSASSAAVGSGGGAPLPVVCFERRPEARARVFFFAGAGNRAAFFRGLTAALPADVEAWGVEYPGRGVRATEPLRRTMAELVDSLLTPALVGEVREKPFAFAGYSMGAFVAYELALAMKRSIGIDPLHFFPLAMCSPTEGRYHPFPVEITDATNEQLLEIISFLSLDQTEQSLLEEMREAAGDDISKMVGPVKKDTQVYTAYVGGNEPLACPITLIAGREDPATEGDKANSWRAYTSAAFQTEWLPGRHGFVRSEERAVAALIGRIVGRQLQLSRQKGDASR